MLPKRGSEGSVGHDLSATYNCVIPTQGKGIIQTGLAIKLPPSIYARITPCSKLAAKIFIDVGVGGVDSDY